MACDTQAAWSAFPLLALLDCRVWLVGPQRGRCSRIVAFMRWLMGFEIRVCMSRPSSSIVCAQACLVLIWWNLSNQDKHVQIEPKYVGSVRFGVFICQIVVVCVVFVYCSCYLPQNWSNTQSRTLCFMLVEGCSHPRGNNSEHRFLNFEPTFKMPNLYSASILNTGLAF